MGEMPKLIDLTNGISEDPRNINDCPRMSGQEELRQLAMFWMRYIGLETRGRYTMEHLATIVSGLYVDNPALFSKPVPLKYQFQRDVVHNNDEIVMRIIVKETTADGWPTTGGSSFRAQTKGASSRAMCPYRDYFNGTYLICCNVVEDMAEVSIIHEYGNFSAFEAYAETDKQESKRNETEIWREVLTLPKHYSLTNYAPIINNGTASYGTATDCEKVNYGNSNGHWILIDDMWKWVVEGCKFQYMRTVDTQECFSNRYQKRIFVFGDYHVRNFYYYLMRELDPDLKDHDKAHHDIQMGDYQYKWCTSTYVLEDYLEDFVLNLQEDGSYNGTDGGRRENFHFNIIRHEEMNDLPDVREIYTIDDLEELTLQESNLMAQLKKSEKKITADYFGEETIRQKGPLALLIIDLGAWPIISRPIADFVLAIDNIAALVKRIVNENVMVIYQDIPASPFVPYINKANPSNQLYGALNFLACSKLMAVGAHCAPQWRYTLPWIDELLCASNAQTMCYDPLQDKFEVIPAGHVTSQYILRTACGL